MTDTEISLTKKVSRIVREMSTNDKVTVALVLDFNKFNLYWILMYLMVVLATLDRLFGLKNTFYDHHAWFQRCTYVGGSRTRPPRIDGKQMPESGDRCHRDHKGGLEGIRQKIWTLLIQLIIRQSMLMCGVRGTIMGQGDNQVIILRLTREQSPRANNIAMNFLQVLGRETAKKNITLKLTECFSSKRLVEVNKELYLDGTQPTNGLKFGIKMVLDANDASNIFETRISSITTIAESIAKRASRPDLAYALSGCEIITQVAMERVFGDDKRILEVVPVWSTALGGLSVASFCQLVMRGHPDMLTVALSLTKYIYHHNKEFFSKLSLISPLQFSPYPSIELLLVDPHALDLVSYLSAGKYVRDAVKEVVVKTATNPDVTKYFTVAIEDEKLDLIQVLGSLRPYAAQLASELFRCSKPGITFQILSLFDNSRTLVRLAQPSGGTHLVTKVRDHETQYKVRMQRLVRNPIHANRLERLMRGEDCPTRMALILRHECFGFEVHGATVACPVDQIILKEIDLIGDDELARAIIITVSNEIINQTRPEELGIGPFRAYIGSKTVEKVVKTSAIEIQRTRQVDATLRLATLRTWVTRTGSPLLIKLVDQLLEEKHLDIALLAPIVTPDNIHHRLQTTLDSQGVILNRPIHMLSHVKNATSGMIFFQAGEADYTIMFQPPFHYHHELVTRTATYKKYPRTIASVLECDTCSRPVPSETITVDRILSTQPELLEIHQPPLEVASNEAVSVAIAIRIATSFRKHQIRSLGDPTDMVAEVLPTVTNAVNLSDFRRCDLLQTCISLAVRTPYLLTWAKGYKTERQAALAPSYYLVLAGCLIRTQRLQEISRVLDFVISYDSAKKTISLAKQIFITISQFCLNPTVQLGKFVGKYFTDEAEAMEGRIVRFSKVFPTGDIVIKCLGKMSDLTLLESTPIFTHATPPCPASASGIPIRRDCESLDRRVVFDLPGVQLPKPMYHLARGMGNGSSAASKIYQIICDQRFPKLDYDVVACLADECGCILNLLLHVYPLAKRVFNTWMDEDLMTITEPGVLIPSALLRCALASRVVGLSRSVIGDTDTTLRTTLGKIIQLISSCTPTAVLLTMDAESSEGLEWEKLLHETANIYGEIPLLIPNCWVLA